MRLPMPGRPLQVAAGEATTAGGPALAPQSQTAQLQDGRSRRILIPLFSGGLTRPRNLREPSGGPGPSRADQAYKFEGVSKWEKQVPGFGRKLCGVLRGVNKLARNASQNPNMARKAGTVPAKRRG